MWGQLKKIFNIYKQKIMFIVLFLMLIGYFGYFSNTEQFLHDFKNIKNNITEKVVIDRYNQAKKNDNQKIEGIIYNENLDEFQNEEIDKQNIPIIKGVNIDELKEYEQDLEDIVELAKIEAKENGDINVDELPQNKINAINELVEADMKNIIQNEDNGDYYFIKSLDEKYIYNFENEGKIFFEPGRKFIFDIPSQTTLSQSLTTIANKLDWEIKWNYVDDLIIDDQIEFNGTFYEFLNYINDNYLKKDIQISVYKKSQIIEISQTDFAKNNNIKQKFKDLKEEKIF